MALYIPQSIFHLARLLYVRPETFGPHYVCISRLPNSCYMPNPFKLLCLITWTILWKQHKTSRFAHACNCPQFRSKSTHSITHCTQYSIIPSGMPLLILVAKSEHFSQFQSTAHRAVPATWMFLHDVASCQAYIWEPLAFFTASLSM